MFLLLAPSVEAETSCSELQSLTIPAAAIGLPSGSGTVRSATDVAPAGAVVQSDGGFVPAAPAYCMLLGVIAPLDRAAPLINFQINLPVSWNGKAVQYGGGGFNGTLVTGLAPVGDATPGAPTPLAQGYVTFGTDSGHQSASLAEPQAFALNDESLTNFAFASYKKVRDAAVAVMRARYGRPPTRIYYFGTSEGGREGLTMAQRFPLDYDGIVSRVPVINWTGLQHAGYRNGLVQRGEGWLTPAKVQQAGKAVLLACDALDGIADGIVSNYLACGGSFKPETLLCADGQSDGSDCLSARQVAAFKALHSPYEFSFELANGVRVYPGFGYGGEAQQGGLPQWFSGSREPAFPTAAGNSQGWSFGSGAIRYFVLQDGSRSPFDYSPDAHVDRVRYISGLMDSTNPDLAAFARHGKLILKEHMSDYAQSPYAGIAYYQNVVARMGQPAVDSFMRLYVTAGVNHGGTGISGITGDAIPNSVDLLRALDHWVDRGEAPSELVQTSVSSAPDFTPLTSRPLCRYPAFPRYKGSGDPKTAASYTCAVR
jgi:feruloyl esterase